MYSSTLTVCKVYPEDVTAKIEQPDFPHLIEEFIYEQQHPDNVLDARIANLPTFYGKITLYLSAVATFHAPSDILGIGGMCHKHICVVKSWRNGPGHYGTIFINTNSFMEGMQGLNVAHV